ncbi:hypothetical protein HYP99_gp035 [Sinorhizobium phage ort11]|uniref:Uncharacterized protein n=1 Tax=Sinorhizobium phage ort11 TaxID=2599764 RepID=A0A5C2H6D0_9CAUD|nr:hypothetical protein HYP99_gp035 [Sinorhizobium phage ort11]QEP29833.1 hypothetical protein Smphiort11_035 [Sinorhizobium phage ort11]
MSLKSDRAWRHNGLIGCAHLTKKNLDWIMNTNTTTQEAKNIAYEMYVLNEKLIKALKTRVDS